MFYFSPPNIDCLRPPCCKLNRVTSSQSRNYVSKSPESHTKISNITAGFLFECLAEFSENVVFFLCYSLIPKESTWMWCRAHISNEKPCFTKSALINRQSKIWMSGLYIVIFELLLKMFVCKIWGLRKQSIIHQTGDRNKICYHK